ncbi:MAG: hypothetical protein ACYS15_01830 [Planctomycetota bacterium]
MPVYSVQPDAVAATVFRSLRRRFLNALLLVAMVIAVIVLGFFTIDAVQDPDGDWGDHWFEAVWNTLNLVSTVGSLTVESPLERAWGMLAIVIGLGRCCTGSARSWPCSPATSPVCWRGARCDESYTT